eukprot:3030107-Rhodomonas_salina.2
MRHGEEKPPVIRNTVQTLTIEFLGQHTPLQQQTTAAQHGRRRSRKRWTRCPLRPCAAATAWSVLTVCLVVPGEDGRMDAVTKAYLVTCSI